MNFHDLLSDAAYLTDETARMHENLEGVGAAALRRLNPSARASTEDLAETEERMRKQLEKCSNLIGMLEKHRTDIAELQTETEQEIIRLKSDRIKCTSPDEIMQIEERLSKLQERKEQLEWMQQSAGEMADQFQARVNRTGEILQQVEGEHFDRVSAVQRRKEIVKGVVNAPARAAASAVKRTAKDTLRRANPLDKKINKREISDHGIESLRLAYRTGKKTVQTAQTVKSTAKATKATVNAVKKAPRVIANTAKSTVRAAVKTVQITANIVTHIAAALINPITWIILFFCLVIYVIMSIVVMVMGAAGVQEGTHAMSYTQQVGIDDDDLDAAREYYRIACERNKANYGAVIDSLYYSNADHSHSDLVYMERSVMGTITQYTRGYPTPTYQSTLKSAWMISVPESEAIAIAYVYLQMQENNTNGTQQQIYQIDYTQDVFNLIVDHAVMWSDTQYPHQSCAENNCSEHHDSHTNPAYTTALNDYNRCVARRDDFNANVVPWATTYHDLLIQYNNLPAAGQGAMQDALDTAWAYLVQAFRNWESVFGYTGWEINADVGYNGSAWLQQFTDSAWETLQSIPETITNTYYTCDHLHTLHSIGLYNYDKNTVMTALGFTDTDKDWESLIEQGMIWNATGGA